MGFLKTQYIYHDKLSRQGTYPYSEKPKNKLAGNCVQAELQVYLFFILHSKDTALIKRFTINFKDEHLESKHADFGKKFMLSSDGYCDVNRFEFVTRDELVRKRQDPRNGFIKLARLCDEKWHEIQELIVSKDYRQLNKRRPEPKVLTDLIHGVNTEQKADEILKELHLI